MVSLRVLEAQVQQAKTERNLAAINKQNTPIGAPRDGQIGEAYVRPEQDVSAGSNLMSLVPRKYGGSPISKKRKLPASRSDSLPP